MNIICTGLSEIIVCVKTKSFFSNWKRSELYSSVENHMKTYVTTKLIKSFNDHIIQIKSKRDCIPNPAGIFLAPSRYETNPIKNKPRILPT
jgi:hypothetical protein